MMMSSGHDAEVSPEESFAVASLHKVLRDLNNESYEDDDGDASQHQQQRQQWQDQGRVRVNNNNNGKSTSKNVVFENERSTSQEGDASFECECAANEALQAIGFYTSHDGGEENATPSYNNDNGYTDNDFDSIDFASQSSRFVRLAGLAPKDARASASVIFSLCRQRQIDMQCLSETRSELGRMSHSMQMMERKCTTLQQKLESSQRQYNSALLKWERDEELAAKTVDKWELERRSWEKERRDFARLRSQFEHERRKREVEERKMKIKMEKLINTITNNNTNTNTNTNNSCSMSISNNSNDNDDTKMPQQQQIRTINSSSNSNLYTHTNSTTSRRNGHSSNTNAETNTNASTNAFYRSIVGTYEQKQRELVLENGDLKAQLRAMEIENKNLMNNLMEVEVNNIQCIRVYVYLTNINTFI